MSKANFELAVAGVEHLFSKFRKNLPWAHDVLKGWAVQHTARHTIPMSKAHTTLYAVHFSSLGAAKLAAAMLVQRELGLRPS